MKPVVLGAPSGPRHNAFVSACRRQLGCTPTYVSYADLSQDPESLRRVLGSRTFLRVDTPDAHVPSLQSLHNDGRDAAAAAGFQPLGLSLSHGGILPIGSPAQLYFGLLRNLFIAQKLCAETGAQISTSAGNVAALFDKTVCNDILAKRDVCVPDQIGAPESFDELVDQMAKARCSRAFVKMRYGAAAAGMIALARSGPRWVAYTTGSVGDDGRIYSTRRITRLTSVKEIAWLVDELAPLGLHVERWIPKVGMESERIDLRIVSIGSGTLMPVVRGSRNPMTNLHLGGTRYSIDTLVQRIGQEPWDEVKSMVREAASVFSDSVSVGIDVALSTHRFKPYLLEVNAFGDFVNDLHHDGVTPFEAQIQHMRKLALGSDGIRAA